jgi:uncharacterized cupin superfamily protein
MNRQNLFADDPWDVEDTDSRCRIFWRPDDARMGASLYELGPGYDGDKLHMHYGAEEMFFVLSGRPVVRNLDGEEELAPGDFLFCPEGRAGLHAFTNPHDETARILAMSAGGYPDVVAYPEGGYGWVATRVPELPAGDDPGIIARFAFHPDQPDDRVS